MTLPVHAPGLRPAAWPEWTRLAFLALAALLLRLPPWLAAYPLHRDEALYGSWARAIASGSDPFLLAAWVDKPPLVLYLLAGSVRLFGASSFALRLPGMVAGLLLPLAAYGFARRMGGKRLALAAGALTALSPFAVLFAPTAFTDPWLAVFLLAAAWAALAARPGWAGLCLGLAIASKQNGLLAAPLVIALLWRTQRRAPLAWRFAAGLAVALAPVVWWDGLRQPARPSFWSRSLDTYGGLGLAAPAQWGERAAAWATQVGYLFGPPVVTAMVLALATVGVASVWRRAAPAWRTARARQQAAHDAPDRIDAVSPILAVYILAYLALHFFVTFQPWDRYLLPIVPLLAILAAEGGLEMWDRLGRREERFDHEGREHDAKAHEPLRALGAVARLSRSRRPPPVRAPACAAPVAGRERAARFAAAAGLAGVLLWSSWLGVSGRLPVGSDHWAYAGLEQVAARVATLPWDAVVYERSLGWQLDFYFPGYPPARIWWDAAQTLVDDAQYGATVYPDRQQWVVVATAAEGDLAAAERGRLALAGHGLDMVERERIFRPDGTCSFILYEIMGRAS